MKRNGLILGISLLVVMIAAAFSEGNIFLEEEATGEKIYAQKCATCHGEDARGDTKMGRMTKTPDLTTAEWKNGTELGQVIKTLKEGLGKMPPYKGKLSEEELRAVAAHTLKLRCKTNGPGS